MKFNESSSKRRMVSWIGISSLACDTILDHTLPLTKHM
jgi:hypothetical protein